MKKNLKIRLKLKDANLMQWELAEILKISEATMCKNLRKELDEKEQNRIIRIIEQSRKGD